MKIILLLSTKWLKSGQILNVKSTILYNDDPFWLVFSIAFSGLPLSVMVYCFLHYARACTTVLNDEYHKHMIIGYLFQLGSGKKRGISELGNEQGIQFVESSTNVEKTYEV